MLPIFFSIPNLGQGEVFVRKHELLSCLFENRLKHRKKKRGKEKYASYFFFHS